MEDYRIGQVGLYAVFFVFITSLYVLYNVLMLLQQMQGY